MKVVLNTEKFKSSYMKIAREFPDLFTAITFEKEARDDVKKLRKVIKKLGDDATRDRIVEKLRGKIGIGRVHLLLREYEDGHWYTEKIRQKIGAPKNRYILIKDG